MQQTEHFKLNQYELTDRILMEKFNSDNAKIDAALKAHADAIATAQTALALCGNCRVVTTSYTGTGNTGAANAKTLTFEKPPLAVLIFGKEIGMTAPGTDVKAIRVNAIGTNTTTTWAADKKSVSWHHTDNEAIMLNSEGYTYHVVIFYTA